MAAYIDSKGGDLETEAATAAAVIV